MPTLQGNPQSVGQEDEPPGPPVRIDPARVNTNSSTDGDAGENPIPLHATSVPRPYTDYPDRLNGKVFFTGAGGGNFVCSGTVVNSENKSIVWTAGHCVHGGQGSQFHQNWVFVPAYSSSFDGHRPYGTWAAKELWTRKQWANDGNFRHDLGAVVLNQLDGQRIGDALGAQGIVFNLPRKQAFSSFGYPQASPFNGFLQWRCDSGRLGNDFPPGPGPATIRIHCNMTGGSSGGGWLINIGSDGIGSVNGLNSYRYSSTPDNLFGPYHGNQALKLYNSVRNRPA